MEQVLTKQNIMIYAMRHYNPPSCSTLSEFEKDLLHFKYLKRLLTSYVRGKQLTKKNARLMLNHVILLSNVFELNPLCRMLFFKMDRQLFSPLKTLLEYLQIMPKEVVMVPGVDIINTEKIPRDMRLWNFLKTLDY